MARKSSVTRTPVVGSARTKGISEAMPDPALAALVSQLQQISHLLNLQALESQALKQEMSSQKEALLQQIADEHKMALEAMNAAKEALETIQEKKPVMDPEIRKKLEQDVRERAAKATAEKKRLFMKKLQDSPKGTLYSTEEFPKLLQINGIGWIVKVGRNENVPQPFIEQWYEMLDAQHDSVTRQHLMAQAGDVATLEDVLVAGRGRDQNGNFFVANKTYLDQKAFMNNTPI